jgi:hypothetical protein
MYVLDIGNVLILCCRVTAISHLGTVPQRAGLFGPTGTIFCCHFAIAGVGY